jgi:hypothetical protein
MRRLYPEELEALQEEFISFLVMEGIDKDEWVKIKAEQADRANSIIDQFSYAYFNVMLAGIQYATIKSTDIIHTVFFRKNDLHHLVLNTKDKHQIAQKVELYEKEKLVTIYDYLEQGFKPDNGEAYKELALLFAENISPN